MRKTNSSTWLVVDDEPGLSEIMADALAALGLAQVENYTSSTAALAALAACQRRYDVVITDRDMPDLDGMEFSRRLREYAPEASVVLVSAHTDDLTAQELHRAGIGAVVGKPFSLRGLEAAALRASDRRLPSVSTVADQTVLMAA